MAVLNRRDTLKLTGAGALAAYSASRTALGAQLANDAVLKLAGYPYDRVQSIRDGSESIPGLEAEFQVTNIYELNDQVLGGGGAFDIAEVGLLPYMTKYIDTGFRDYVLLPIFISRSFRHRNIYVHADSGIEKPRT